MSGGSYDYAYEKVQEMAERLEMQALRIEEPDTDSLRLAFAAHLRLVARAMHDVEWVDSNDKGRGDEHAAIRAVLRKP